MSEPVSIPLANGGFTLVDAADQALASPHRWTRTHRGYACRVIWQDGKAVCLSLHRVILDAPAGLEVDHIDGDRLNNQRSNLRLVTRAENAQNRKVSSHSRTGVRGVQFEPQRGTYRAAVYLGGKRVWQKRFASLQDAERAVVQARAVFFTHHNETRSGSTG